MNPSMSKHPEKTLINTITCTFFVTSCPLWRQKAHCVTEPERVRVKEPANWQIHSKREENAGDWCLMLTGLRNSLTIQLVNNISGLRYGSLLWVVTRDEAWKNWLNFYKHASWLDNILSNRYKLPFICCQFLTSAILSRLVYLVFQSSQYYDLDHSPLSEFWNGLLIVISFQFALVLPKWNIHLGYCSKEKNCSF